MSESNSVSYSLVANASPAIERKAIIVSSLNLGNNLGTAFPLKCINRQTRTDFKWLNRSDSSWAAGWCHLGCQLRVWKAARKGTQECPSGNSDLSLKGAHHIPAHKVTNNNWADTILTFLSCSLGLSTVTMDRKLGCLPDGFPAGGRGCYLHNCQELGFFLSQAAMFMYVFMYVCVCHICVNSCLTPPSLSNQQKRF